MLAIVRSGGRLCHVSWMRTSILLSSRTMSLNQLSMLFKFAHSRPVEAKTGRGATKSLGFNVAQRLEVASLKEDAGCAYSLQGRCVRLQHLPGWH